MKASFNPAKKPKFTRSHRKESACHLHTFQVLDFAPGEARRDHSQNRVWPEIELRVYVSPKSGAAVTACLWVNVPANAKYPDGIHTQGSGKAGGGGYDRKAGAAWGAIHNTGFELSEDISGSNEIPAALHAIALEMGMKNPGVVESYA